MTDFSAVFFKLGCEVRKLFYGWFQMWQENLKKFHLVLEKIVALNYVA